MTDSQEIPKRMLLVLTILSLLAIPLVARALGKQEAEVEEKQIYIIGTHDEADFAPKWVLPRDKYKLMQYVGIPESDWQYVDYIIQHESEWRHNVWNYEGSGAYGLCQTMLNTHGVNTQEFKTSEVAQMKWCNNYANTRYGGWKNAKEFWQINRWW